MAVAIVMLLGITAKAQFVKAEVQVSGLTCSMCQLATEKAIKTLDFVAEVKPDLNKNVYLVSFKKDKSVQLDLIKKKVKDAGFSVSKLVAIFNFDQQKISNDFHFTYAGNKYHFMDVSEKTLDGPIRLTVLDKDFIPAGDFKKRAAKTSFECYRSGVMGKTRTYHVTL
jgi:copper chaperone CopZ